MSGKVQGPGEPWWGSVIRGFLFKGVRSITGLPVAGSNAQEEKVRNKSIYPCIHTEVLGLYGKTDIQTDQSTRDQVTRTASLANSSTYKKPWDPHSTDSLQGSDPGFSVCIFSLR